MSNKDKHICPVKWAKGLDSKIRRWAQNPEKILQPYIKEGMTVMDLGCGPGFFTIDMAELVGSTGRVIAVDLQKEMLEMVKNKIEATEVKNRVTLHKCQEDKIGFSGQVDFALLFYIVHELRDQDKCFNEIASILKPNGQILIVEPPIHVSKSDFQETMDIAKSVGFDVIEKPKVFLSKTVVMEKIK